MKESFVNRIFDAHKACDKCPTSDKIEHLFQTLLGLLFPSFSSEPVEQIDQLKTGFERLQVEMADLLSHQKDLDSKHVAHEFFEFIPKLYDQLLLDIEATYSGDPAARSRDEVVRSYPGFYAIAAYRVSHMLLLLNVEKIPRAITELAHSKTGIDIHPAAHIGEHFCIDHGTGVVIGETTIIGNHVKIYQGVTLGALSVDKAQSQVKRHPTIEDHVIIYAGATILGGETIIGESSVIGGNVWLTKSVPPNSKIYYQVGLQNSRESTKPSISQK
ncbi:serine acetyltransferase [Fulvivirga sp. RKSG066]|uniref:serine O-acetyltransferase n=1 Tax=Fulvivirga aurantia TaxID=2529383 RepID=UPI0012BB9740|nr:serine acetyltransferase [Fulvivirga aurantia]MTI19895.1 serine acetyltransferase [Fulvivirga aurantia]